MKKIIIASLTASLKFPIAADTVDGDFTFIVVSIISTAEIKSHLHAPLLTADQLVGVPGVAVPEFQSASPVAIHSCAIN